MKKFFFILFFLTFNSFTYLNALDVKEVNYYKNKKAWLVNDGSLPIVAIKFAFKAGSSIDVEGKKGTANLAALLLDEGAGDYSAKEFKKIKYTYTSDQKHWVGDGFHVSTIFSMHSEDTESISPFLITT